MVPAGVTLSGFKQMVNDALRLEAGSVSDEDITATFRAVDTSGDGELSREEFVATVQRLRAPEEERSLVEPSVMLPRSSDRDNDAEATITRSVSLMGLEQRRELLSSWQIMYCGGSKPVVSQLKQIRARYAVSLRLESFDW